MYKTVHNGYRRALHERPTAQTSQQARWLSVGCRIPGVPWRMPRELFPFPLRCELTGKWVRASCLTGRHEIAERYKEWEIVTSDRRASAKWIGGGIEKPVSVVIDVNAGLLSTQVTPTIYLSIRVGLFTALGEMEECSQESRH